MSDNVKINISSENAKINISSKEIDITENDNGKAGAGLAFLIMVIVVAILAIFGPIIAILGMRGKFLLGRLFKKVQEIDDFKKFRKTYTIICLIWWGLSLIICLSLLFLIRDIESKITWFMIANYIVWAINFILIFLSIDIGDKIYTQHGGYKVINGIFCFCALLPVMMVAPLILILGMYGKIWLLGLFKNIIHLDAFKKMRGIYTIACLGFYAFLITISVLLFNLVPDLEIKNVIVLGAFCILYVGSVILSILSLVIRSNFEKKINKSTN